MDFNWVDIREMLPLVQIQSTNYILSEKRQLPQATFSWVCWTAEGKILSEMKHRGILLCLSLFQVSEALWDPRRLTVLQRACPTQTFPSLHPYAAGGLVWRCLSAWGDVCQFNIRSWHISLHLPLTVWQKILMFHSTFRTFCLWLVFSGMTFFLRLLTDYWVETSFLLATLQNCKLVAWILGVYFLLVQLQQAPSTDKCF